MNQKTTYEIIIAEKLEQVSIPDLSEMIWSRIETELDLDPGDIDGGDSPTPGVPPTRIILGGVVLVFIAALTYYFFNTKKTNGDNTIKIPPTEQSSKPTPLTIKPPGSQTVPVQFSVGQKQTPNDSINNNSIIDQLTAAPIVIPPANDSTGQTGKGDPVSVVVSQLPPVTKDSTPLRKNRGVSGISPGDYKIVPKKDSSK